jgi:hypothetical protein
MRMTKRVKSAFWTTGVTDTLFVAIAIDAAARAKVHF